MDAKGDLSVPTYADQYYWGFQALCPNDREVLYNNFLATAKLRLKNKPYWWPTAVDWDFINDGVLATVKSKLEEEPKWWPTTVEWGFKDAPDMEESEKSAVLACVMRNYDHQDLARILDKVSGELYTTNCFTIVDRLFAIGNPQSNKSQEILRPQNRPIDPKTTLRESLPIRIFALRNQQSTSDSTFRTGRPGYVGFRKNTVARSYASPVDVSSKATLVNPLYVRVLEVEYHCRELHTTQPQLAILKHGFSIDIASYSQQGDPLTSRQSLEANYANSELILADSQGNNVPPEPAIGICITRAPVIGELFVVELEDHREAQEVSFYMAYSITMAESSRKGGPLICLFVGLDKISNTIISMEVFKKSVQIGK
ncbi:hypothetical protein N7467_001936 [Penicillium canescens]|nr:hypothetical protein N7467_001936 [Penicillium canescens]